MARTSRASSRRKSNAVTIDFSGVETLGRFHEDGDYRLKVVEVTQESGDKYPYLSWTFESLDDPEGARVYNNTSLSPQSLWNLKALLEALGQEVPDSELELDLDSYADLEMMGKVEMEPYEGKSRPRLADFWPAEDEKPKGKAAARGKTKDDDGEDEPKTTRGRGKASTKKAAATVSEDDIEDMNQEELDDLIKEHDLDVDLEDFRTLRKMKAAVIDAAQEAGIIGEGEEPEDEPEEDERPARRGRASAKDEEDEKPATRSRRRGAAKEEPEDEPEDEAPARRSRRARR